MIKNFKDWLNENCENCTDEELKDAERDTMEYDSTLDSDKTDYPDVEDDFADGEEEEE